jgi:hypothetical protein
MPAKQNRAKKSVQRKAGPEQESSNHSNELHLIAQLAGFQLGIVGDEAMIELPSMDAPLILPGCGDLLMAKVDRLGHRGEHPIPQEWENLLAMLEPGHELLWIISKRPVEGFAFYLAVKTNGAPHLHSDKTRQLRGTFRSIVGQFSKRSFPESIAAEVPQQTIIEVANGILDYSNGEVVVTSGLPSISDIEDNREFSDQTRQNSPDGSLNDIVEPFTAENAFSIVFTVGRAPARVANERLSNMLDLRSAISPHLKVQRGDTASLSEAISKGTQASTGFNASQAENRGKIATIFQSLFGSKADAIRELPGTQSGEKDCARLVEAILDSRKISSVGNWWKGASATMQKTATETVTDTTTRTNQTGTSTTLTHSDAMLEHVDQKLQDSIRSLKKASGTGAYFMAAEIFSPNTELSLRIARSISGSLAGAKTHARPFQTAVYRGSGFSDHLLTVATIDSLYPAITLESRHVAAQFLPVPEADLPGLRTKRNVFYGKPNAAQQRNGGDKQNFDRGDVWLGDLSHLGYGTSVSEDREFRISEEALTSHLLIAGTTGSGKTQRAAAILNRLPTDKFQIVVIESAKKTYRKLLRRDGVKTKILALGEPDAYALRINPFFFEPNTSLKRHISIFSDALADLLPVEALIGPKLREAIQRCYIRYQWDIERGVFRGEENEVPVYPTMVDLHMEVLSLAKSLNYGPEVKSNYQGALLGRSRLFIDELYQDIFGWGGSKSLDDLFGEDDVIIEMDSLPPSEAKMPSFVLSLLLERMRSWQTQARHENNTSRRDIILVIEEAHNLLDKRLEQQQSGNEMGSGRFLLQQIVRLLQEGREAGLGVIVIDQSPASLADAVVRNTNTKIILRIGDAEEAEKIGSTLGLKKEDCRDLHELEDGESVVKVKNAGRAIKLSPLKKSEIVTGTDPQPPSYSVVLATPDYYSATKAIFEITSLLKSKGKRRIESTLKTAVGQLKEAANGNEEASRFFRQKLLANVSEEKESEAQESKAKFSDSREWQNLSPDYPALPLLLCGLAECHSYKSLRLQLQDLGSQRTWSEVRPLFDGSSLPMLPLVREYLEGELHWREDAAQNFIDLLMMLNEPERDEAEKEDAYSILRKISLGSSERFDAIRTIMLLN